MSGTRHHTNETCAHHGTPLRVTDLGAKIDGTHVFQAWCPSCKFTPQYRVGEGDSAEAAIADYRAQSSLDS